MLESSAWSNVTDPWNQDWSSYKADELYAWYEGWYDDEASWYYDYEDLQNMENSKRHGMKLVKKNLLIKPKMNLQNHPTMWMKHTSKERANQDPQQWDSAVQRAAPSGTMRTTARWRTRSLPSQKDEESPLRNPSRRAMARTLEDPIWEKFWKRTRFWKEREAICEKRIWQTWLLGRWTSEWFPGLLSRLLPHEPKDRDQRAAYFQRICNTDFINAEDCEDRVSWPRRAADRQKGALWGEGPWRRWNRREECQEAHLPVLPDQKFENFHMVRGRKVFGLLVDTGAASGGHLCQTRRRHWWRWPQEWSCSGST